MNDIWHELNKRLSNNLERQIEVGKDIASLPKGHINTLFRNNKGYYYLTYREEKRVVNKYLGPVGKYDLNCLINRLKERENAKKALKELKIEEAKLRKLIKVAK